MKPSNLRIADNCNNCIHLKEGRFKDPNIFQWDATYTAREMRYKCCKCDVLISFISIEHYICDGFEKRDLAKEGFLPPFTYEESHYDDWRK